MTNEEKKEYLRGYLRLKRKLARVDDTLAELRMNEMYPSLLLNDMPTGHIKKDLSDYIAKVDSLIKKYMAIRYDAIETFNGIRDTIETLPSEDERDILYYRYLFNLKWEDIEVKLSMSERTVFRIHGSALNNLCIK